MEDLARRCLKRYVDVECKPSTAARYRQLIGGHILPALGEMAVTAVKREHVAALHHELRDRRGAANTVLWALSRMFSLAEAWGEVPEGTNPCPRVVRYKRKSRERFLTEAEFERLGRVLS